MVPEWLHILSLFSVALGGLCALGIAVDAWRDPQHMWIMNLVWPAIALSGGPLAVWFYVRYGRLATDRVSRAAMEAGRPMPSRTQTPFPAMVGKGTSHCGAGCTLGDILAEGLLFLSPGLAAWFGYPALFGERIFAVWVLDFIFAFAIGIAFQYFAIKPMRDVTRTEALALALKADTLSLSAWQIGMYGFMGLAHFWIFGSLLAAPLEAGRVEFWFMMQIAMLCGFATAYPVNWWLIRAGIKEKM